MSSPLSRASQGKLAHATVVILGILKHVAQRIERPNQTLADDLLG